MLRQRRRRTLLGLTPLACAWSAAVTAVALLFFFMLGVGLRVARPLQPHRAPLREPPVRPHMRTRHHATREVEGVGDNRSERAVVDSAEAEAEEEDEDLPERLVVITVRAGVGDVAHTQARRGLGA